MKSHLSSQFTRSVALAGIFAFSPAPAAPAQETKRSAPVHSAAEAGDTDRLAKILDADPEAWKRKDKSGDSPLHVAAWKGQREAVVLLLDRGAGIDARGSDEWTALHYAARGGHVEVCRLLLERGADREARDDFARTALESATAREVRDLIAGFKMSLPGTEELTAAAQAGRDEEVLQWLAKDPTLIDARDQSGGTAVMAAASENRTVVLERLIEHGADLDLLASRTHKSALELAAARGHLDTVRLLLKHGVEVNPSLPAACLDSPLVAATITVIPTEAAGRFVSEIFRAEADPGSAGLSSPEKLKSALDAQLNGQSFGEFAKNELRPEPDAVRESKRAIVKLLLEAGADPTVNAPILTAAMSGETEMVRRLLESGADPNAVNRLSPATPLVTATLWHAPAAMVQLLLEAGAEPFPHPKVSGDSALVIAIRCDNEKAFDLILASLKTDTLPEIERHALLAAAADHSSYLRIVLATGIDVNAKDAQSITALHLAAHGPDSESVRLLLEAGAEANARDHAGYTPLHNAVEYGHSQHIALLLKHGADIEAKLPQDRTPLSTACKIKGNAQTVRLLIEAGADIHHRDEDWNSPLFEAAANCKSEIVEVLIEAGADPNEAPGDLGSVLGIVASGGRLFQGGARGAEFHNRPRPAPEEEYLRLARFLIERGADVNAGGRAQAKGLTPLEWALQQSGSRKMVELLLEHGAGLELKNEKLFGCTPIFSAIASRNQEFVELLIERGAKLDALDLTQLTPLHFAAGLNSPPMVEILLRHDADINARQGIGPRKGATPLFHAVFTNSLDAARVLLRHGADTELRAQGDVTPLNLARSLNNAQMVNLLTNPQK